MQITIVSVGKLKEKYWNDALAEFQKRLSAYTKLNIVTILEEKMPENPSDATRDKILAKETGRLIQIIPKNSYVILLDLQGKEISSPSLAAKIQQLTVEGHSHLTFVIGGPFGYTDDLRKLADFRWSFSPLTFTHQMIKVMLVEQIYRAFKIMRNEKYHH